MSNDFKIVEIVWADSVGVPAVWESVDEIEPLTPSIIVSVGYLLEETPEFVTICQSLSPYQYGRRFTIPRGCITRIKEYETLK